MDPFNLRVEVTQLGHLFPFGTALKGEHIRSCLESGEDDLYCTVLYCTVLYCTVLYCR